MTTRRRRVLLVLLALVLVAVAAGVAWWLVRSRSETRFEEALGRLPADSVRFTWTDWRGVREELGEPSPADDETDDLLDRALDLDLASASVLSTSPELARELAGFDPLLVEWEAYGQGHEGSALLVKLSEDADLDAMLRAWERAGRTEPDDPRDGGVWKLASDSPYAGELSSSPLTNLALLEDERLVVASAFPGYAEQAVTVAQGEEDGLDAEALAGAFEEPVAGVGLVGDQACTALALSEADAGAAAQGEALVDQVGGVAPLTGYLVALLPGERIGFAFDHETTSQAERDTKARRALAGAEDPGQMVHYSELFEITDARSDETVTLLEGDTVPDAYPLSNTSAGPVLLATC